MYPVGVEGELILEDGTGQPMAEVVQDDAHNSQSLERSTFVTCQQGTDVGIGVIVFHCCKYRHFLWFDSYRKLKKSQINS